MQAFVVLEGNFPGGPFWKHDCDNCVYLGSSVQEKLDFYVCKRSCDDDSSYIARFGEGSEYCSYPGSVLKQLLPHDLRIKILKTYQEERVR